MTKEIIEEFRNIIKPYVGKQLLWTNFEELGESDKAEFERDFDEILDLAILALEQNPCEDIPTITIPVEDYIKLTKQEPTTKNDLALIHTEGLDEEIRCTMCTNYMKSDRGCDGSCVVDKDMYKAVMDAIEKRIQPTTKNDLGADCIDRQAAITFVCKNTEEILKDTMPLEVKLSDDYLYENVVKIMRNPKVLPSVTPQEPFINKPCVSSEVCEHDKQKVLDEIRAEIMDCLKALDNIEKSGLNIFLPNEMTGRRLTYQQCLGFIDKYKIEPQESEDT